MKMYCAQPMIEHKRDGYTASFQVPTFYLHPNVQGITNEEHAQEIVREIVNPTNDANIIVHPNVTLVDVD